MDCYGGIINKISMVTDTIFYDVVDHEELTKSYFRGVLVRNHLYWDKRICKYKHAHCVTDH